MSKNLVIIPTYNEKENIQDLIAAVGTLPTPFDILIIDDGSPDQTAAVVKQEMKKSPSSIFLIERSHKSGLGTAYVVGFRWGLEKGYDYICQMDADFSHNPKDLTTLLEKSEKGADLVIGSRYVKGVNVVNWPIGRVLLSYFASYYVRLLTGMPFRDTTAGFKCYRRKVFETLDLDDIQFIGYAFQIEMKFKAWMHGLKIEEIPIIFTDRSKGQSKMSKGIFNEAIWGIFVMKVKSFFKKFPPPH